MKISSALIVIPWKSRYILTGFTVKNTLQEGPKRHSVTTSHCTVMLMILSLLTTTTYTPKTDLTSSPDRWVSTPRSVQLEWSECAPTTLTLLMNPLSSRQTSLIPAGFSAVTRGHREAPAEGLSLMKAWALSSKIKTKKKHLSVWEAVSCLVSRLVLESLAVWSDKDARGQIHKEK